MRNETKSLLRLFNGVKVADKTKYTRSDEVLAETVGNGYILDPSIEAHTGILEVVNSVIGMSGEKANSSFHKSWAVVRDASIEQLVLQQILHYITTYGFKALGCYDSGSVYIPTEELDVPDIKMGEIRLVFIKAMTFDEILEGIITLGSSGIALAEATIADIMTVLKSNTVSNTNFVHGLKNRELKAKLYDYYGITPTEPVEFLRFVINKLTDETLLIKNYYLINKIKESDGATLDKLMVNSPKNLASIFYRFKPLFLAMKSISNDKSFYNRLRKQAVVLHKPLKKDYLNSVTEQIKNGTLDLMELKRNLDKVNNFRKIRLAQALQYRLTDVGSIVYSIRNGRNWVADFNWAGNRTRVLQALNTVMNSVVDSITPKVEGKKVYVPKNIHYAMPATEKQFTGNFPSGSYVTCPSEDLIVGIHWKNLPNHQVDLDLSMKNKFGKIGWDGNYRSAGILFSGDVVDAPKRGASELFYYGNNVENVDYLVHLNYYNFEEQYPVEYQLIIASEKPIRFGKNYMVDPNNIHAVIPMKIDIKQDTIGFVGVVGDEARFYFASGSDGKSITSKVSGLTAKAEEYYRNKFFSTVSLMEVLESAGAELVYEVPEEEYIDLVNLDKTSFIELLS